MGQAKQRGTFEQRQTEAFIREAKRQELKRLEQEREKVALAERKENQRVHVLGASAVGVSRPLTTKGD